MRRIFSMILKVIDDVRDAKVSRQLDIQRIVRELVVWVGAAPKPERKAIGEALGKALALFAEAHPHEAEQVLDTLRPLYRRAQRENDSVARKLERIRTRAAEVEHRNDDARSFRRNLVAFMIRRDDGPIEGLTSEDAAACVSIRQLYLRGAWNLYGMSEEDRNWWEEHGCARPDAAQMLQQYERRLLLAPVTEEEFIRLQLEEACVPRRAVGMPLVRVVGERWLTPEGALKFLSRRLAATDREG